MPIFQDDLERRESAGVLPMASPPQPQLYNRALPRKVSEESIRTELCDGPIPDSPRPRTPENDAITTCCDRQELIERLKRGESPTWIPNRHFDSIWSQRPVTPSRSPKPTNESPTLLPPPTITPEKRDPNSDDERRLQDGLNIERPRSALHSGDFTHDESPREGSAIQKSSHGRVPDDMGSSGHCWLATSPPRNFTPFQFERTQAGLASISGSRLGISSLSSSLSSSFIYQAPTSPLVQSESNEDIDLAEPMDSIDISSSLPRNPRRHSLMSNYSGSYGFSSPNPVPRHPPSLRQERTLPYQAHQPRRSLTATPNFSVTGTSPQTPAYLRSRRPSYSSDISPLQHASMVGSYEESILRGRMSTTPSKPLDFVAQIGVLGLGKCKPSLKCPPHVTLPFPAVFYSYASSSHGRSKAEDGPSPYVGQVDLENGLSNQEEEVRSKRKIHSRVHERRTTRDEMADIDNPLIAPADQDARRVQKHKRRSGSPKAPPGGSYRIPERGQIQIIIKNPNKTAVKLFLVPYDLAGMEAGTKTFIRQRSYSAGPIIDNVPELKESGSADRPILRYLVHLHICCPSRGRFYLYKNIRVVFANRVPDGKEKLQNEITLPEPRFTTYKPLRVMHPPVMAGTGPGASLAAEKAFRRRSSGFYIGASNQGFDTVDEFLPTPIVPRQQFSFNFGHNDPVDPIPFRFPGKQSHGNVEGGPNAMASDVRSEDSSQNSRPTTQDSSNVSSWSGIDGQIDKYEKLMKGDVGYGGNAFSSVINGSPGTAEGLLSQRLRTLGVNGLPRRNPNEMEE